MDALTTLTQLSQSLAAVTLREELYDAVTRGARQLLGADACQIWRLAREADELALAGADPADDPPREPGRAALLLDLMRRERGGRRKAGVERPRTTACCWRRSWPATSSSASSAACGAGAASPPRTRSCCRPSPNQTAVGLKKAELIERLTAENIVKDMFDALAAGAVADRRGQGRRGALGLQPPARLHPRVERAPASADGPPWPELAARVQARLQRRYPRALFDARHDALRGSSRSRRTTRARSRRCAQACDELGARRGSEIGISDVDRGVAGARRRMREAADAASIGRSLAAGGGAVAYEQLGAYRYLVHLELDEAPHDRYGQAVDALVEYDRRRNAQLVETLECYLGSRSSVAASARALFIHPNTVRQRLERIERMTGLDLRSEDLLSLELALKLARLHARAWSSCRRSSCHGGRARARLKIA